MNPRHSCTVALAGRLGVYALEKTLELAQFRSEGDKIFAFKPKPNRFLCFFVEDKKIVITNGFTKKQDKLPPTEKKRALSHRADYLDRTKKGSYYDG